MVLELPLGWAIEALRGLQRGNGLRIRKSINENRSEHNDIPTEIERGVDSPKPQQPTRRLKLEPPLIPPAGRHIALNNEAVYELIELP